MKYSIAAGIGIMSSFIQLSIITWIGFPWPMILFPITVMIWFVFHRGTDEAITLAIASGLVLDVFSNWGLGVNTLAMLLSAFAVLFITTGLLPREEQFHLIIAVLALSYFTYLLGVYIVQSGLSLLPRMEQVGVSDLASWSFIFQVIFSSVFYFIIIRPLGRMLINRL